MATHSAGKRYVPESLSSLETRFYFAVWIFHSLAAFYIAWSVCDRYRFAFKLRQSIYFKGYQRDDADVEWSYYKASLSGVLPVQILHMISFNTLPYVLPKRATLYVMIVFWIAAQILLASVPCVLIVLALSAALLVTTHWLRTQWLAWIVCLTFVLTINKYGIFSHDGVTYYCEFNFYLYSAVKMINMCIYLSKNAHVRCTEQLVIRYLQYLFYPPYAAILIVLFDDFNAQMDHCEEVKFVRKTTVNLRPDLLWKLFRLIFWFFTFELLLHFITVYSLYSSHPFMFRALSNYEIAAVAYVNGQFFHLKYQTIFGLPSWFALVDQMRPPGMPICISRVSHYSMMWRFFDRGLYQFLKNQVYLPIVGDVRGKYYTPRRLAAIVFVFLFVLSWHGTQSFYIYWVLLNAFELCIEWVGATIWRTSCWAKLREIVGLRVERRIIAVGMAATVIPGIFGVFFFLGGQQIGGIIFDRILRVGFEDCVQYFFGRTDSLSVAARTLMHLLCLGYCYNHVCLELDRHWSIKRDEQASKKEE